MTSLGVLLCAGCTANFQRKLIYFPPPLSPEKIAQLGDSGRLMRWDISGGAVGWWRPVPQQPASGRVLILHGNADVAAQCAHYADAIQANTNFDIYVLEYPGYADRAGTHTEATLEQAAEEAFQALPRGGPTYVAGESLGTGVACWLAGKYPDRIAGVILLAPFNKLSAVGWAHIQLLPVYVFLHDPYYSQKNLRPYSGPLAVLVGGKDKIIPQKIGRRLYDSYRGPKRLWEIPEADHVGVMQQPASTWKEVLDYLQASR
jgi:uncharacterized protein